MYLEVENNNKITQKLKVGKKPITLGSAADCDVRLAEDSYNSVITSAFGVLVIKDGKYLSDKFATYLNGRKINQSSQLKPGDVITFDNSGKVRVLIREGGFSGLFALPESFAVHRLPPSAKYILPGMLAAGLIVLLFVYPSKNEKDAADARVSANKSAPSPANDVAPTAGAIRQTTGGAVETNQAPEPEKPPEEVDAKARLRTEIDNFLRKTATNNAKAVKIPPEEELNAIAAEIERNSASEKLGNIFDRFNSDPGKAALPVKIREKNLPAGLVVISALVDSENENLVAASEREISRLYPLSITFSVTDSDSSLLVVAAKSEGTGSARSHPLLERMRRLISNSRDERNVWFLASKNGIDQKTKEKILRFIALGVIAQNPGRYRIDADPII